MRRLRRHTLAEPTEPRSAQRQRRPRDAKAGDAGAGGWGKGSLDVIWAFVVGGIGDILAFVRAGFHHETLSRALERADIEFISAAPPPSHGFDMLRVTADGEQR